MKIMRIVTALLLCLAFMLNGVAHAAMPCCQSGGGDTPTAEQQLQEQQDNGMPCHQMAKPDETSADADMKNCTDCDCQHCAKLSAVLPSVPHSATGASDSVGSETQTPHSFQREDRFHPPKHIS